jgi:hypothetical protein
MCASTVGSVMKSRAASAQFETPSAPRPNTSRSRWVSSASGSSTAPTANEMRDDRRINDGLSIGESPQLSATTRSPRLAVTRRVHFRTSGHARPGPSQLGPGRDLPSQLAESGYACKWVVDVAVAGAAVTREGPRTSVSGFLSCWPAAKPPTASTRARRVLDGATRGSPRVATSAGSALRAARRSAR